MTTTQTSTPPAPAPWWTPRSIRRWHEALAALGRARTAAMAAVADELEGSGADAR